MTLSASRLFSQLRPDELEFLSQIAREQSFAPSQEIFKEGDLGDGFYLVNEGLVEISGLVGSTFRHVFSRVGPGDIFGEMAVVDNQPRSASAIARGETTVYFFPREEILRLVERSPLLSLILLREISNRLREFNRQYLREALQTERLTIIGRFARTIVHDLKNPLNIIGLTAEMAATDQATPELRRQAKRDIRKQVERITDMISEILDFTQGAPMDQLLMTRTDYGRFVQQVLDELRPEVALRRVHLEVESPLPAQHLELNPKRLYRVFQNLLHNATDALSKGGRIFIRFRQNAGEVITEIEDTGPGIAPEIASRLFEPFATYGKTHGTGLGLSICKRIIEDHHGWICAQCHAGRGAVFLFGLPVNSHEPNPPAA